MAEYTAPGVYVEEVSLGPEPIEGVATSTTGFVGPVASGPVRTAVRVRTWPEYERAFGGLDPGFHLAYAVWQFFLNGGTDAWVVGVPEGVAPIKGLGALDVVPRIALLCLPGEAEADVLRAALAWADRRRVFLIVDAPGEEKDEAVGLVRALAETGSATAAVYFPWVRVADPLKEGALRECPPSGSVMGVYARTDRTRGVWKAPAGSEAVLLNAHQPAIELRDDDVDTLTAAGVNSIRAVPGVGTAVWGARTVQGAEETGSEWKYVPVRRLGMFIEESLHRGTRWAVFEPNDEPLWASLRLAVEAFLDELWRRGAFEGRKAEDAYFVRCGKDTMTQEDIDRGHVNVEVGFAPVRPAEFLVVRIQQRAERVDTEVLGQGTGEPAQRLPLPLRMARGKRLSLGVGNGGRWSFWTPVESLRGAAPTDRVFMIERKGGDVAVAFGDGEHGAVPPAGSTIRATYRYGGGGEDSKQPRRRSDRPTGR